MTKKRNLLIKSDFVEEQDHLIISGGNNTDFDYD